MKQIKNKILETNPRNNSAQGVNSGEPKKNLDKDQKEYFIEPVKSAETIAKKKVIIQENTELLNR